MSAVISFVSVRVYVAVLEAELVGHRAEDLVLSDRAAGNEDVESRLVFGAHGLCGGIDLFLGQEAALDQNLQHIFVVTCHLNWTLYILFVSASTLGGRRTRQWKTGNAAPSWMRSENSSRSSA